MDIREELRGYLAQNVLYVEDDYSYSNDASFIQEGLIDSMGIMELVTYVQKRFGIGIAQEEVVPENFDSVNKLAAFIERKLTEAGKRTELYAASGRTRENPAAAR